MWNRAGSDIAKKFINKLKESSDTPVRKKLKSSQPQDDLGMTPRAPRLGIGAKPRSMTKEERIGFQVGKHMGKSFHKTEKRKSLLNEDMHSSARMSLYGDNDDDDIVKGQTKIVNQEAKTSTANPLEDILSGKKKKSRKRKKKKPAA
eukprot:m.129410 g.129410  ORF g.129410 m.129410 type:complete len:147 (-) comp14577_c0_seq1:3488-3928(-)